MKAKTATAVLLACASVALAEGFDEAKFSDEAQQTARQLRERIKAEVGSLPGHPWAGEYYCGDGLGMNVSFLLAPAAGYLFEWHGCLGVYDRNYGAVTETNGRVHLAFTFENVRKGFQGIADEFIPVAWGERHYLVPADDIVGFCNNVNEGREPRDDMHGFYPLRRGDEKQAVSGFPAVPEAYRPYLLSTPITAEITDVLCVTTRPSVCDWKFRDTTVALNAGTDQGLLTGMELQVVEPESVVQSVRITDVAAGTSKAVMTQAGAEKGDPEAGWRLSTRCPWVTNDPASAP